MTYFILRAYTGTGVSHSQRRKKSGEVFEKNAGEWTGRVEIRKKFLAISVVCMAIYTDLLQALKGVRLSSVFSPDGTLISASAAPHCRVSSCST